MAGFCTVSYTVHCTLYSVQCTCARALHLNHKAIFSRLQNLNLFTSPLLVENVARLWILKNQLVGLFYTNICIPALRGFFCLWIWKVVTLLDTPWRSELVSLDTPRSLELVSLGTPRRSKLVSLDNPRRLELVSLDTPRRSELVSLDTLRRPELVCLDTPRRLELVSLDTPLDVQN